MSFKENSYLQLWLLFHSAEGNHLCNFSKEQYEEHFCDFFLFGRVMQEEISIKDVSYLQLWLPFCSVERHHLCNFGRGHYEIQFFAIFLILDLWFKSCRFQIFLICCGGGHLGLRIENICPILEDGIIRIIPGKLF